jgi:hypothetical protein
MNDKLQKSETLVEMLPCNPSPKQKSISVTILSDKLDEGQEKKIGTPCQLC